MKTTALLLAITLLAVLVVYTHADFYFNHVLPKAEKLESLGHKCVPGRTVIRVEEKSTVKEDSDYYDESVRRSHMNSGIKEEHCKICVCSVEGKDEYCSGRPARNVNECLRMSKIMEDFKRNVPYDHTRGLAYRIRRDYLWHYDEIPYESKAKCRRGTSYYSNDALANDTDIDVASDIESLLDYSNKDICYHCVCALDGRSVNCMEKDVWFCNYFRYLRERDTPRDMYTKLFQQDRPAYFRQLSWRLRRTMDSSIYDFVEAVGSNSRTDKCIPFVSQYSDCTEDNLCSGCNNCLCVADGEWSCKPVKQCPGDDTLSFVNEDSMDEAMYNIESDMTKLKETEPTKSKKILVPGPAQKTDDDLLLENSEVFQDYNFDKAIINMMGRKKRSIKPSLNNTTPGVQFYNTVDEFNEDTLQADNATGTIKAKKFLNLSKASRRNNNVMSKNDSLHIEFRPNAYDPHITDNKIDTHHGDEKLDNVHNEIITTVVGNQTQKQKDKEISKIIVNELQKGTELIGDSGARIMSNITFTPENDTLTAMAFIAGNLLNQLWNMEKDSSEEPKVTEDLKHEKISDLLELFKEPLNLRQESFLKNALEHLSEAIDKDKILKNVSLCEKIEESKNDLRDQSGSSGEMLDQKYKKKYSENKDKYDMPDNKKQVANEAVSKINNVLSLINKFQTVQKKINTIKQWSSNENDDVSKGTLEGKSKSNIITKEENSSLNVFGKILNRITKLIVPPKKSRNVIKSIRNHNVLKHSDAIGKTLKSIYGMDINRSTLTSKDKIILDYLNLVTNNPNCLLNNLKSISNPLSGVEGDILLNLSHFFKIKSYVELLKILEPSKKVVRTDEATTFKPELTSPISSITPSSEKSSNFSKTKENLKAHLSSIIEDLNELQLAKGVPTRNFSIADTLPCIYNLLNFDKGEENKIEIKDSLSAKDKVTALFNALKKDLNSQQTRRSGTFLQPRPKSAIVWERIIKNFSGKDKQKSRRVMDNKVPKQFDDLKKMVEQIDSGSKSYKNMVILKGVPATKRLLLLKSIHEETKKYIEVLKDINDSYPNIKDWSTDKQNVIRDFIHNAALNIILNGKIASSLNKTKPKSNVNDDFEFININEEKKEDKQPSLRLRDISSSNFRNNVQLSRDDIIHQLIKNRMQLYIKEKELKGLDQSNDVNYAIAKRILAYLEMGNYDVAIELYKSIVNEKQKKYMAKTPFLSSMSNVNSKILKPIIQFEQPTIRDQREQDSQNLWLRQLMNLKNI